MERPHEEIALAQRRPIGCSPCHLPRHQGQRCRQVMVFCTGAGELDAERALGRRDGEVAANLFPQHFLGNAHADGRHTGGLTLRLDVMLHVVAQVEEPLLA